jgi:hypothetical protein
MGYRCLMDSKATPSNTNPLPRELTAGERQWTLTKDGRRFTCELRGHGKYGWDCQFFEGDECIAGRRFPMRAQAVHWATSEREEHELEGWTLDT